LPQSSPATPASETRAELIDVAEELFASRGIAGVSLREIGRLAGCANTGAVRYHFGDRDGLVAAVFRARLGLIEQERASLLAASNARSEKPDLRELVEMLLRPVERQRGRSGQHSYAAFLAGLVHFGEIALWSRHAEELPATQEITERMQKLCAQVPAERFAHRILLASNLVWTGLSAMDRRPGMSAQAQEAEFRDLVAMAASALAAPSPA
jgi:AcrR family transcriptional regulator